MGCKKEGAKKQGLCYSKRGEAAWSLLFLNNNSRTSNIESNDSQNGGLENYNMILIETFHILVPLYKDKLRV